MSDLGDTCMSDLGDTCMSDLGDTCMSDLGDTCMSDLGDTCVSDLGDTCDAQGACSARKRPAKDGREENRFVAWSFAWSMVFRLEHGLSNHEDARDEVFSTLSSGKTETRRREHSI